MKLFTKLEMSEIAYRLLQTHDEHYLAKKAREKAIEKIQTYPNYKFIRVIRQATELNVKVFAKGIYYIDYNKN